MHSAILKSFQMEPPPSSFAAVRTVTLPDDIIFSILMNLPVKLLLTFRCVCKNWDSIIRSQTFMLNYSSSRPQRYLFVHFLQRSSMSSLKTQPCTVFCERSFSVVSKLEIPSTFGDPSLNPVGRIVIGSCNGLLCITNSKSLGRELYLWNPSIRKHKILTSSSLFTGKYTQRFTHPKTSIIVGLGFDSNTSDYKILRIAYFYWKSRRSKSPPPPQAEVYSLSTDSWRIVELPDQLTKRLKAVSSWNYAYLNGAFHWLTSFADETGARYSSILTFDVSSERLSEMKVPDEYMNGIDGITQRVVVLKGLLGLVICGEDESENGGHIGDIWRRNGDLWSKQRVEFGGMRWHCGCSEEHLVLAKGSVRVFLFNPQSLEERALEVPKPASVHAFSESLALL